MRPSSVALSRVHFFMVAVFMVALAGCGDDKGPGDSTGAASTGAGTTEAASGSSSDAPTSSGTTAAPVCEGSPDDNACAMCNNANCCAQIMKCQAEPACACMTDCVTSVADISMCTDKCGTSKNFSGLSGCGLTNCASECT